MVAHPENDGVPPDFASEFSHFSCSIAVESLDPRVIAAAKANLLDTLACAAAGRTAEGVLPVIELVGEWGGKGEARIWGTDMRVPAHHAALVNGMMAHARDYDDTHDAAVLHAGVSVIPAAIAAAELAPDASGADLIAGIVAGLELICRLGKATTIGIVESGFMYTALFGHFAATVAAARVMRFDARQTANALGIVYSQAAGTHQVTRDAALTKRMQPGFAAKAALLSVMLSRKGVRGAYRVFEGEDGLFRSYLRGRYDSETLRCELGSRFEFLELSYKPYPCCRFNHAAIDAALQLHASGLGRIKAIACGVNRQAFEAVCTPPEMRKAPGDVVQAQFSLPFTVACALVKGRVTLADFAPEALGDPEVLAVAALVEARCDADIERDWSRGVSPARLDIETDDGLRSIRIDLPKGHPEVPLNPADIAVKLRDCLDAGGFAAPGELAERMQIAVASLDRTPNCSVVASLLDAPRSRA